MRSSVDSSPATRYIIMRPEVVEGINDYYNNIILETSSVRSSSRWKEDLDSSSCTFNSRIRFIINLSN